MRWLLVLALLAGLWFVPSGDARAAIDGCTEHAPRCDQGEAMMSCQASLAAVVPPTPPWEWKEHECVHAASTKRYWCKASIRHPTSGNVVDRFCGYHYYSDDCTKRNVTYPPGDMQPALAQPASDCYGGCRVAGTQVTAQVGGITIYGVVDRSYTGETCTTQVDANAPINNAPQEKERESGPKEAECVALGAGQTGCVKPNGDYCATASTGKTFCWTPGQEGAQVDGDTAQVKSKTGEPVKPPDVAVPDKDWQRKEGHQVTECTGSGCKTSNVTNYQTVPAGQAKNSTGDNKPDGTGNTSGNGQQDQGKDSATDSGNCTSPPVCVGDTLKCLHLRYTWKIECNTKGNEVTAGVGCSEGDVPVCAGSSCKAEAYASVLQQWKQRCALEAMAAGNKARADGIDNGADAGVVDGIWITPGGNGPLTLRTDLVQVGGNGSLLPEIEIEGQAWNVPQGFYDAIAAVRMVIIAMCTVLAMFVVGRNI